VCSHKAAFGRLFFVLDCRLISVVEQNFYSMLVFKRIVNYSGIMQLIRVLLAACVLGFTLPSFAEARLLDQYKSIIDRNPFALKDPPPPAPVATVAPKPEKKEEFYLTGISTIGNAKRPKAYLVCKDGNKKEYDQKFYNLTVGDRQGDLTLLDVDPKGRRVKVVYMGEEKWLSMKEDGVPAPAGPAPGVPGAPIMPGAPGGAMPGTAPLPLPGSGGAPVAHPQPLSYPNANSNRRIPRTANSGYNGYNNNAGYSAPNGTVSATGTPTMAGSVLPAASAGNVPPVPQGPQTEADVALQLLNMQANYQNSLKHGIPSPPIPTLK
jgi:hypothetical protein